MMLNFHFNKRQKIYVLLGLFSFWAGPFLSVIFGDVNILGYTVDVFHYISLGLVIAFGWEVQENKYWVEPTPTPCPHGHIDWDDCPVCGH